MKKILCVGASPMRMLVFKKPQLFKKGSKALQLTTSRMQIPSRSLCSVPLCLGGKKQNEDESDKHAQGHGKDDAIVSLNRAFLPE